MENRENNKVVRIDWIDMTRGLVMILTVYSHCGLSSVPILSTWVYSFYMPLFFFVSGILLKVDKYTYRTFLLRRWQTLYKPYLFFSIVLAILSIPLHASDYLEFLKSLITNGWGGYALWFIPVLALAEFLFFVVYKTTNCKIIHGVIACVCLIYWLYTL